MGRTPLGSERLIEPTVRSGRSSPDQSSRRHLDRRTDGLCSRATPHLSEPGMPMELVTYTKKDLWLSEALETDPVVMAELGVLLA